MKISYILPLIVTLLIAIVLWVGLGSLQNKIVYKPLIGKHIDNINLKSIINNKPLNQVIKEQKYILYFFSSWCGHCAREHKELIKMKKKLDIPIYGIVSNDSLLAIKVMLSREGNPFNDVAIDDNSFLSIDLGVNGIPEAIIIEDGKIIDRFRGGIDYGVISKIFASNY